MVSLHWERRTDRDALALVAGLALLASGCGGRVGWAHKDGGSSHSAAEGGRGAGGATVTSDDDDDNGAAHSGTSGAGGRSAGSGGSTGSGGSNGQAGSDERGSTTAARTGFAIVAGGTLMRSKSYALVLSAGESPGNNGVLHSSSSSSYRMVGGLVGVTAR
ncbi:MAG: hypothetical protein JW940_33060 [Polyangiaceae bacterium]|nr:hypothetical protein [Polyangiaceae bacterium]